MADGTQINPGTGGDVIATDDLNTINGSVVSGQKAQRVKVGYGVDGALQDVEAGHPLPATDAATQSRLDTLHADAQAVADAIVALGTGGLFTDAHGQALSAKLDPLATEATLGTLVAKLPASLVGGRLDVTLGGGTNVFSAAAVDNQSTNVPLGVGLVGWTGSVYRRVLVDASGAMTWKWSGGLVNAPADAATQIGASFLPVVFNGTTYDKVRSAESAQGTSGTGLQGVGTLYWDGLAWQRWSAPTADASSVLGPRVMGQLFNGSTYDRMRGSTSQIGRMLVQNMWEADSKVTGALAAANATATLTLPQGASQAMIAIAGTFAATITFEVSFDGATSWFTYNLGGGNSQTVASTASTNSWWEGAIPAGATHIRGRISGYTSGTANLTVAAGQGAYEPAPNVVVAGGAMLLNASTNRIGQTAAPAFWNDETTTPLASGASVNGSTRDVTAQAAGSALNSNSFYVAEFRAEATSDVAGTLYIEVSRDGTTWRRIKSMPMAQADATSVFYAELIHKPKTRYVRAAFVNGGSAQTHFALQTMQMAS